MVVVVVVWGEKTPFWLLPSSSRCPWSRLNLRDDELCSRSYLDEPSAHQQLCPTRRYEVCRPIVRPNLWRCKFEFARNLAHYKNKSIVLKIIRYKYRPYVHLYGETTPRWKHFHHHQIIPSSQGPSVLADSTHTFLTQK
jgi:hypothetical protein